MPVYQYVCEICGKRFERRQSFHEAPLDRCPAGHTQVHRIIGPVAVHFKGSGFYVNDSKQHNSAQSS